MNALNVHISENLSDFVQSQAFKSGCSPEGFVENLIKEHRQKTQRADLEAKLAEAVDQLDRGEGQELPPGYFDQLRFSR